MKTTLLFLLFSISFFFIQATTITVTNSADSGVGSLRQATVDIVPGDTIQFSLNYPDTIVISQNLYISKDVHIIGPGADLLSISSAGNNSVTELFELGDANKVSISGLSFVNSIGVGISNYGSEVEVNDCIFRNIGQGLHNGYKPTTFIPFVPTSIMTVNNCQILESRTGGGISNKCANGDTSILIINYCLIQGNNKFSQGIIGGGGISNTHEIGSISGIGVAICSINNSSILDNTVSGRFAHGGGVYSYLDGPSGVGSIQLNIENCTISGNYCESGSNGESSGGGIKASAIEYQSDMFASVKIAHSTITNNRVGGVRIYGMGLDFDTFTSNDTSIINLNHNIIAGNKAGGPFQQGVFDDIGGPVFLNGYNIIGLDSDFDLGPRTGDMIGTPSNPIDPQLCSLGMNGGLTATHYLSPGSPAINAGSANLAVLIDQRDSVRIGIPDIGAVEYNPNVVLTQSISGTISQSTGAPLQNSKIFFITYNDSDSSISVVDSVLTDMQGNYSYQGNGSSELYVKAAPDSATYPLEIPTYFDSSLVFQQAESVAACGNSQVDFHTIAGMNPGGPGFIGGFLLQGANKDVGDPLSKLNFLFIDSITQVVYGQAKTNDQGEFFVDDLPLSTYHIWVDKPFIDNSLAPSFTLTSQDSELKNLKFELHSTYLEWVGFVNSLDDSNLWDKQTYSVFPNPGMSLVNFRWDFQAFQEEVTFLVYDLTGKLLLSKAQLRDGEVELDVSKLSEGLYLYKILQDQKIKGLGKLRIQ